MVLPPAHSLEYEMFEKQIDLVFSELVKGRKAEKLVEIGEGGVKFEIGLARNREVERELP
jgi:hypothetical protein